MLLNILQCSAWPSPSTVNYPAPNFNSAFVEKPCFQTPERTWAIFSSAWQFPLIPFYCSVFLARPHPEFLFISNVELFSYSLFSHPQWIMFSGSYLHLKRFNKVSSLANTVHSVRGILLPFVKITIIFSLLYTHTHRVILGILQWMCFCHMLFSLNRISWIFSHCLPNRMLLAKCSWFSLL